MMLERFIWFTSSGIASAVTAWIGIAAFLTGLNKFGLSVKFPLWLLFLVLWVVATFAGFLAGSMATKTISLISQIGTYHWHSVLPCLFDDWKEWSLGRSQNEEFWSNIFCSVVVFHGKWHGYWRFTNYIF